MSKPKKIKISLCLIVRNERKSSEVIFPQIPQKSIDEIYVIDGNSTDGTQAYFKKQGVPVYQQSQPGLGGATVEARNRCKTDAMIFFHPDGNEDPKDIAKIADLLRQGAEFVIPSRMIKDARNEEDDQLLKPRKWFNQFLAFFINFIWNDYHKFNTEIVQGFRGIRCDVYDKLQLNRTDLTIDFQMVIRALKHKVKITEFPTIESDRLFGETTFGSLSTGVKELEMLHQEIVDPSTY